jgi:hypothetical protein
MELSLWLKGFEAAKTVADETKIFSLLKKHRLFRGARKQYKDDQDKI